MIIKVIVFWRIWNIKLREDVIDYVEKYNIKVIVIKVKIYLVDVNFWYVLIEGGDIEYLENEYKKDVYK